jgi:DNA-binding NarL/FixJ family response regulator
MPKELYSSCGVENGKALCGLPEKLTVDNDLFLRHDWRSTPHSRDRVSSEALNVHMKPTVVIAEDHLGCLEDISKLITQDYEIVAVATDGKRGLSAVLRARPDVVILDISLPEMDGISAAKEIRKYGLKSKILFLSVHEEPEFREGAFNAGANGYVFKSQMNADILNALKEVLAGHTFLSEGHPRQKGPSEARKPL